MNKKLIIQLVIISAAFIGAGVVLYNGFFKNNNTSALVPAQRAALAVPQNQSAVLPYGNKLDFSVLTKQNLFYNQVSYPLLDPANDYGIPEPNLITPPTTK
jgi:hypothetical protein